MDRTVPGQNFLCSLVFCQCVPCSMVTIGSGCANSVGRNIPTAEDGGNEKDGTSVTTDGEVDGRIGDGGTIVSDGGCIAESDQERVV